MLNDYPQSVTIMNFTGCNMSCPMCYVHGDHADYPTETMPQEMFERIVREVGPGTTTIGFSSLGEPFLDPLFEKRLEVLRDYPHVVVQFQTNGTLLDPAHLAAFKDFPNPLRLHVSVDSVDPVVYATIRRPFQVGRVLRNLRTLRANAKALGFRIQSLELNATLMIRNLPGIPDLIRFAHEVGAETIRLTHVHTFHPDLESGSLALLPHWSDQVLAQCRELASSLGILLDCPAPFSSKPEGPSEFPRRCDMLMGALHFGEHGEVWPCCGNRPVIGDMGEGATVAEAWHGAERQSLIDGIAEGLPRGRCKDCPIFQPRHERILPAQVQEPTPEIVLGWLKGVTPEELHKAVLSGLQEQVRHASESQSPQPGEEEDAPTLPFTPLDRVAYAPAGLMATRLARHHRPMAVFDLNPARYNGTMLGIPVLPYEEIRRIRPTVILVANPAYEDEIVAQLEAMELTGVRILRASELSTG
jgi:MoaA/NifB/PqqE/SkfB family radical SAM enzyme